MQVLEVHSAFLSNYEVLQLLQEDVQEQNKVFKNFKALARKENTHGKVVQGRPYFDEQAQLAKLVPDNLRTLQVESLKYLKQPDLPCIRQKAASIRKTLKAIERVQPKPSDDPLADHGLTKTEKLTLVNLAPDKLVDLNVIIDELDARFTEEAQQEMLDLFTEKMQVGGQEAADMEGKADEAMNIVKEEEEEMEAAEEAADEQMDELDHEVYGDDGAYHEDDIMPDEENDLIDEGLGDGGRDTAIREIDELDES